jgi:hypothetical protein
MMSRSFPSVIPKNVELSSIKWPSGDRLVSYTYLLNRIIINENLGDRVLLIQSSNCASSMSETGLTVDVGAVCDSVARVLASTASGGLASVVAVVASALGAGESMKLKIDLRHSRQNSSIDHFLYTFLPPNIHVWVKLEITFVKSSFRISSLMNRQSENSVVKAKLEIREETVPTPHPTTQPTQQTNLSIQVEEVVIVEELENIKVDSGEWCFLRIKHSNKVFDIEGDSSENGAKVLQFDEHGGSNQLFRFEEIGDGWGLIRVKHSNKVFDIEGWSTENAANVLQFDEHGGSNQLFRFEEIGDGWGLIRVKHSNKVFDIEGGSTENAANVLQFDQHGGDNQLFRFDKR